MKYKDISYITAQFLRLNKFKIQFLNIMHILFKICSENGQWSPKKKQSR